SRRARWPLGPQPPQRRLVWSMSPLDRNDRCGSPRDNDIHAPPDELGRDLCETLVASFPPAILDGDGSILDPAEFAQSLYKGGDALAIDQTRVGPQEPDGRQLAGLLRARRERPRRPRAAEKRDERAPLHSITSSARTSTDGGIINPRAFAAPSPRAATLPRRAWLRIFVVRCGLPCDPPVGGHSCNEG